MTFELQNRQITATEIDGNIFLCIMYGIGRCFRKASLWVTFVIDLCSYIKWRTRNYRYLSPVNQEISVNVNMYMCVLVILYIDYSQIYLVGSGSSFSVFWVALIKFYSRSVQDSRISSDHHIHKTSKFTEATIYIFAQS